MRLLCLAAIAALAYVTPVRAQGVATVVVYVTVPPSSPPASAAIIPQAASTEVQQQDDQPTPSPSSSHVTSSTSSSTPSPTSRPIHEATSSQTYPSVTAASSTASADYEPGSPGGGQVDTAGGASGSDAAAFRLSKGGLAAILIVVILVSLFGSKYHVHHSVNNTNMLHSRKYRTVHRRKASTVDHASDSHTGFSPPDWAFRSAKDTPNRICSEPKLSTHRHPHGQPAAACSESRLPSWPQKGSRRRCQRSREGSTAAGRQGTQKH